MSPAECPYCGYDAELLKPSWYVCSTCGYQFGRDELDRGPTLDDIDEILLEEDARLRDEEARLAFLEGGDAHNNTSDPRP